MPTLMEKIYKKIRKDRRDKSTKINPVTDTTKVVSTFCSILFISAIGICAYLISADKGVLGTSGNRTYTISRALANGNKAGIVSCLSFSLIALVYLTILRGPSKYLILRLFLVTLSTGFIISLPWATVDWNKDVHYTFAGIVFMSMFIYEMLTLYYFYINIKHDKSFFMLLMGIVLIITTLLLVFACLTGNKVDKMVFASFEIIFAILMLGIILILGFYKT